MLDPHCERCGGVLRPVPAGEWERESAKVVSVVPRRRDASTGFAYLLIFPWLLPLVGVEVTDLAFLVPLALFVFAGEGALRAAARAPAWRPFFVVLAMAAVLAAVGSLLGVADAVTNGRLADSGFYVGAVASMLLLAASGMLFRRRVRGRPWAEFVDAALLGLVGTAVVGYFLIVPGLDHGSLVFTAVVAVDFAALLACGTAAFASRADGSGRAEWWLTAACAAAVVGDGLVAASAAGDVSAMPVLVALLWAVAGFALATVADIGLDEVAPRRAGEAVGRQWVVRRLLIPLAAVVALPATAGVLAMSSGLPPWGALWFGGFSLCAVTLAFGRQAHLLLERQRSADHERALAQKVSRRNEELEALTGLATTMTQTLEESPIVEQALGVLSAAACASSAALHLLRDDHLELAAAAGAWEADREWAPPHPVDGAEIVVRGRRSVLRLELSAREHRIGIVTLVRPATEPFDERGVELLRLLVDQMGVAVQNARDYREKLEQAIRDPLTGVYNRRFFLEALTKEIERSARYGSEASLVIFDVDDFKAINDQHGHAAGDDALRAIAATVEGIVRPADSFARIGGEEFALLLPETAQLEALMVADRVRTTLARKPVIPGQRVTVSGGIASCPGDARDAEELQRRADAALYWAKRNGKDLCAIAGEACASDDDAAAGQALAPLYAVVAMIDGQHLSTRDHSENVAAYAVAIGAELGLERARLIKLRRAAMLHDIGKIAVRSEVLGKPGKLDPAEYAEILQHPIVGGLMLSHAGLLDEARWVRAHHERVDGRGYPDGISGDELPAEAKILFVADAFEAMTSDRPYSRGRDVGAALDELVACAGSQFDHDVVAAFVRVMAEGRLTVQALRV